MATGKHIGKVVLRVREEEAAGARPGAKLVSAIPRTYMHPAKCYVLVGQYRSWTLSGDTARRKRKVYRKL